jgi:hypothetical protein
MKYAVIVQSAPAIRGAVRQSVVIPNENGSPIVYSRMASGSRGATDKWIASMPTSIDNECVLGSPIALKLTDHDLNDLENMIDPKNLLQKLDRAVRDQKSVSGELLSDLLSTIIDECVTDPTSIAQYAGSRKTSAPVIASSPSIQIVRESSSSSSIDRAPLVAQYASLYTPSITDPEIVDYVERTITNRKETEIYDWAIENRINVCVLGHAGTGKTSSITRFCALRGLPLVTVECSSQIDNSVTQGKWISDQYGNLVWRYSALATAVTQPSIIFLNEAYRMSPKANALFLRLMQERELVIDQHENEILKLDPRCIVIADTNFGYRGTMQQDQAFLDRFGVKIMFNYDSKIEAQIPVLKGQDSLLELAREMRRLNDEKGTFGTPISTRLLINFVKTSRDLGFDFAVANFMMNFDSLSHDAIKTLFETYSANIASELGIDAEIGSN